MDEYFHINDICPDLLHIERIRALSGITAIVPATYIHEVGSTAVEGLIGKQDLDFLARVPQSQFFAIRRDLDKAFSRNPSQLSNDNYQGYKIDSTLDVAIQLTVENGPHDNFLAFLKKLDKSSELRQQYNNLKLAYDGKKMNDYREAKHEFIKRTLGSKDIS